MNEPVLSGRVLIVAGSDSSGGAGIQADLKTVSALGAYGMTAITALTAQNTTGVYGVSVVGPEFVAAQIDACVSDIGCDALKTGMLANAAIIRTVAAKIREYALSNVVVDPVMIAKSGARLLEADAVEALRSELLPLATVVT
ncbi:MAG TPA: bifunctional hydroxymethylpyrimidine kinase/phosphomethylpyrimidine kinase, partial [Planctomycetaceae bacterium]|nr:bifunctional hydroxymethylpyrimidine kinase/phosphomethylpyrimidine kinase [Planctomycetaceae bacterium]